MYEEWFGHRLATLRLKKGVSAREMSLAIGQGPAYINSIENHRRLPSMAAFFYICDYLTITPQEFFDNQIADPARLRQFLLEFEQLDPQYRAGILALIHGLSGAADNAYRSPGL